MHDIDLNVPWYHGSPLILSLLREGSTITRDPEMARVFSHKPSLVTITDEAGRIRHNGAHPGYLYRIAESVGPGDVYPHPRSAMPPGAEWLTRRPLRLELLGQTTLRDEELLSEDEIATLLARVRCDRG